MQTPPPKVNCTHFLVHVKDKLREMSPVEYRAHSFSVA